MDLDVLFLGTAGSAPTARRGLPATLIRRGGERLLFDCGEGTQRQLLRSVGLLDLEEVFISHFHADHFLGLPGLLKTYSLRGRDTQLTLHGPPGLLGLVEVLTPVIGKLSFPVIINEIAANEQLERDGYRIAAFEVAHRVSAYGYALIEDERPGRFDEARARQLGVTPGPDFGRLQRGEAVGDVRPEQVLGEPRRGRKVVLTGDTGPSEMTEIVAHGADLLVHEATFSAEEAERARETGHTTAQDAAAIAERAGVAMLALTHISQRYAGGEIRDEARAVFENTIVPRDFDRVEIPFPERGGPVHHRANGERLPALPVETEAGG
ncbi:MAG: ribonuclease Z [Thermoleophilaceae bacterium]